VVGCPEEMPMPEVNLTMFNNIIAFNSDPLEGGATGIYLGAGVHLDEHHNLFFSRADEEITWDSVMGDELGFNREEIANSTWTNHAGQGLGDLVYDPLFVSGWTEVDLRLRAAGPAIYAGVKAKSPEEDTLPKERDDQPDMGAYES